MLLNEELHRRIGSVPFLGVALGGSEGDHAAVEACPHPLRLVYQFNNRFARIGCPECNVVCVVPQEGAINAWREPLGDGEGPRVARARPRATGARARGTVDASLRGTARCRPP
jgi:hypothetical protein